jgi:fibronectin type 3 domain-containing protein
VYRGTVSGTYAQIATGISATSYSDATVATGTTYYYVVRAFNRTESANSNESIASTIGAFSISLTAALSTTSIQVTWGAATGATDYDVRYGTATGSYTTTVSSVTSPYTITGLTANTTYFIIVRARNSVGSGASASRASSYKIMRGTVSGTYAQIASGVSGTTYTDVTAANGTTYYYAVKSFNGADSANSLEVFKRPIATPSIDRTRKPFRYSYQSY